MSKFVDPQGRSSRAHLPPSALEQQLVAESTEYAELQKQKSVRWFVSHGIQLPTQAEKRALAQHRDDTVASIFREQRDADRARTTTETEGLVVVPSTKHPLYREEPGEQPNFVAAAAVGLGGRKLAFSNFEQLCRVVVLRNRLDKRLQLLAKKSARDVGLSASVEVPRLRVVQLPALGQTSNAGSLSESQMKEEALPCEVKLFARKDLKCPFEFKTKGYRQIKFSDHPFANADLAEPVEVLFAGVSEVPPDPPEPAIPAIEHFVQPVVTMETYPVQPFAFVTPEPWRNSIQSQVPQRVTTGNFVPPHRCPPYGRLAPSTVLHTDPLSVRLLSAPVPPMLAEAADSDAMSDSDDDQPLPLACPSSVPEVQRWLPHDAGRVPVPDPSAIHCERDDEVSTRRDVFSRTFRQFVDDLPCEIRHVL